MTNEILNSASPLIALIIDYALDMVGAVLLLIAGWIVAGWVQKHTARMLGAVERVDATLLSFVTQSVRYTILILVMVAVLAQFGVQTTSIIAVLGAAGLAVGLALQGTLANIAAGVLLLFLRPFKIGEYIDAGGIAGTVREIGLFATEFKSYDGIFVMVPNSQLASAAITNYSRLPTRRLDLVVGISYGDNMNQAMTGLNDLLVNEDRILKDPAPQVMVKELADSSVNRLPVPIRRNMQLRFASKPRGKSLSEVVRPNGYLIPGSQVPFQRSQPFFVDQVMLPQD